MDTMQTAPSHNVSHSTEFLGWIDKVYPPPPTDANSVTLIVQKGSSVILECSPNTTESLNRQTPQLDNKTAVHLLPSGNVLVPDVQEDVSISCVWPLHPPQTRNFHISISSGMCWWWDSMIVFILHVPTKMFTNA